VFLFFAQNQLMKTASTIFFCFVFMLTSHAQPERWQQRADYKMEIDFRVKDHQYSGRQRLIYTNNSPDTLYSVFYHLYFNAFQPGSMMDVWSRSMPDPDTRLSQKIFKLNKNEIGFLRVSSLSMDGLPVKYSENETILEVNLPTPILPYSQVQFDMEFEAQVPTMVRRSGRNSPNGVDYSMAQWYPKICNYDNQGWHANPYIAREFYGVWGDFDVTIRIDKDYSIAATGYLQPENAPDIDLESTNFSILPKGDKIKTWHFVAPNVHDFVWAADRDYEQVVRERADGIALHFVYLKTTPNLDAWAKLPAAMDAAMDFIQQHYGPYAYRKYSFIQGGDGGMEYPMATLIRGSGHADGLVSLSIHELMHAWYQGMLANNESLYSWLDEGFTNWAEAEVLNHLRKQGLFSGVPEEFPHLPAYAGYRSYALSGLEEPMTTHADHFRTNTAFGQSSYAKGEVFLEQLKYIVGDSVHAKGLLDYYWTWRFKHPNANDFIRVMEKTAGLELDWYREYWVGTTHQIDYTIGQVEERRRKTTISLQKSGGMPMPIELLIIYDDGSTQFFYIPLDLMRGEKKFENQALVTLMPDWPWTHASYEFELSPSGKKVVSIQIDPTLRLADVAPENNRWTKE
jgi:hypothetical protein